MDIWETTIAYLAYSTAHNSIFPKQHYSRFFCDSAADVYIVSIPQDSFSIHRRDFGL